MWAALLVAFLPQVVISQGALAQGPDLQQGSKARVVLRDPSVAPFEGTVIYLVPFSDGRIGLGVSLALGGG